MGVVYIILWSFITCCPVNTMSHTYNISHRFFSIDNWNVSNRFKWLDYYLIVEANLLSLQRPKYEGTRIRRNMTVYVYNYCRNCDKSIDCPHILHWLSTFAFVFVWNRKRCLQQENTTNIFNCVSIGHRNFLRGMRYSTEVYIEDAWNPIKSVGPWLLCCCMSEKRDVLQTCIDCFMPLLLYSYCYRALVE